MVLHLHHSHPHSFHPFPPLLHHHYRRHIRGHALLRWRAHRHRQSRVFANSLPPQPAAAAGRVPVLLQQRSIRGTRTSHAESCPHLGQRHDSLFFRKLGWQCGAGAGCDSLDARQLHCSLRRGGAAPGCHRVRYICDCVPVSAYVCLPLCVRLLSNSPISPSTTPSFTTGTTITPCSTWRP